MIKIFRKKIEETIEQFEKRINNWEKENNNIITNLTINKTDTYIFIYKKRCTEDSYNVEELEKTLKIKFIK